MVERYAYDAFGARTVYDANGIERAQSLYDFAQGYQGLRHEPAAEYVEARHRWLSVTLGRPPQRDLKGFAAGDVNVYRWEGNGPASRVDPFGMEEYTWGPAPKPSEIAPSRPTTLEAFVQEIGEQTALQGRPVFIRPDPRPRNSLYGEIKSWLPNTDGPTACTLCHALNNFGWAPYGKPVYWLDPKTNKVIPSHLDWWNDQRKEAQINLILEGGVGALHFINHARNTWKLLGGSLDACPTRGFTGAGEAFTDSQAEAAYNLIRNLTGDVKAISRTTGIPPHIVQSVRQHHFLNVHEIAVGPRTVIRSRFTAEADIAELWIGAAGSGNLTPEERSLFREIIAHEYVEHALMKGGGMPFRSAEPSAWIADGSGGFYYRPNPQAFGAHDLAPRPGFPDDPFGHYPILGLRDNP